MRYHSTWLFTLKLDVDFLLWCCFRNLNFRPIKIIPPNPHVGSSSSQQWWTKKSPPILSTHTNQQVSLSIVNPRYGKEQHGGICPLSKHPCGLPPESNQQWISRMDDSRGLSSRVLPSAGCNPSCVGCFVATYRAPTQGREIRLLSSPRQPRGDISRIHCRRLSRLWFWADEKAFAVQHFEPPLLHFQIVPTRIRRMPWSLLHSNRGLRCYFQHGYGTLPSVQARGHISFQGTFTRQSLRPLPTRASASGRKFQDLSGLLPQHGWNLCPSLWLGGGTQMEASYSKGYGWNWRDMGNISTSRLYLSFRSFYGLSCGLKQQKTRQPAIKTADARGIFTCIRPQPTRAFLTAPKRALTTRPFSHTDPGQHCSQGNGILTL